MKQTVLFSLTVVGLALMAGAAGRPELVAKVASGELKEARASWWGFDAEDSTSHLQQAIASGVPRLIIDKMPSPWVVTPLRGVSNQTLVFEPGAEIRAKRGEYRSKGACLLTFEAKRNVTLEGPGTLRMWHADYMTPAYEKSEWRHALSFLSCSNAVVRGLHIVDSGGDGIYLGVRGSPFRNVDVVIRDVVCRDNHRQGISVISAAGAGTRLCAGACAGCRAGQVPQTVAASCSRRGDLCGLRGDGAHIEIPRSFLPGWTLCGGSEAVGGTQSPGEGRGEEHSSCGSGRDVLVRGAGKGVLFA